MNNKQETIENYTPEYVQDLAARLEHNDQKCIASQVGLSYVYVCCILGGRRNANTPRAAQVVRAARNMVAARAHQQIAQAQEILNAINL